MKPRATTQRAQYLHLSSKDLLDPQLCKTARLRPIAQLCWIPTNPHTGRLARRQVIQNQKLEPARRADLVVRWRSHSARVDRTRKSWKAGPLAHAIPMRAGDGTHQRSVHIGDVAGGDGYGNLLTVHPISVGDCVRGAGQAGEGVGRFDAVLLGFLPPWGSEPDMRTRPSCIRIASE